MTPARRRKETVVAVLCAAIALLIVFGAPWVSLWWSKQEAWRRFSNLSAGAKAALSCTLAPGVKTIASVPKEGKSVTCTAGGYSFSLPAEEYRRADDANNAFDSDKLQVRLLSISSRTQELNEEVRPTRESVRTWYRQTDPYEILVASYSATPAGVRTQTTRAGFQKHQLLLLLKSVRPLIGSEKLFTRFQTDTRKGILAGDLTSEMVLVLIYLPETKEFAELVITGKARCTMEDVTRCIGQAKIRKE